MNTHEAIKSFLDIPLPPDDGYDYMLTSDTIKQLRTARQNILAALVEEIQAEYNTLGPDEALIHTDNVHLNKQTGKIEAT